MPDTPRLALISSPERQAEIIERWRLSGRRVDCDRCGKQIEWARQSHQGGRTRFCQDCSNKARYERVQKRRKKYKAQHRIHKPCRVGLSPSDIGTVSELAVALDLTGKGKQVFRALSPSATCDLVVVDTDRVYRIEVKTAHSRPGGGIRTPKITNPAYFDVLARVVDGQHIRYTPDPFTDTLQWDQPKAVGDSENLAS